MTNIEERQTIIVTEKKSIIMKIILLGHRIGSILSI